MREREEVAAIPLVEERLSVGKEAVETGRVRVRVRVEEREERIQEELARDEVEIERVPMNVTLSEIPNVRLEGNTTIIPVVEEVLVVAKELVLVEEIHLRRKTTTEMQEVPVTVRSERAEIEDERSNSPAMFGSERAADDNNLIQGQE
ncbi:MAG TPA: YsnF/AvaK domain-containing protein [Allosphingosinicella sp.]|nr:YsnF/AvaK domain-containing protein [Allosphingosinicella sp.]